MIRREALFVEVVTSARKNVNAGSSADAKMRYAGTVIGAAKQCSVDPLKSFRIDSTLLSGTNFALFEGAVSEALTRMNIQGLIDSTAGNVSPSEAVQIRHYVNEIKSLVQQSGLPAHRLDPLMKHLNDFLADLDRGRTRTEAIAQSWFSITANIGMGFDNLKPAIKMFSGIAKIVGIAEQAALDSEYLLAHPEEVVLLPPPESFDDID